MFYAKNAFKSGKANLIIAIFMFLANQDIFLQALHCLW